MKKNLPIVLILFFVSFWGYAQRINLFTPAAKWIITNGVGLENGTDYASNTASADISVKLDMKELSASYGTKFVPGSFDLTTDFFYRPTIFTKLNMGIGTVYHFCKVRDFFHEYDFLIGPSVLYSPVDWFALQADVFYFLKAASIPAIKDKVPVILNHNLAVSLRSEFTIAQKFLLQLSLSSITYYRYMLFFAPDLKLSFEYRGSDFLSFGVETEVQYIDFFTLSANFNSLNSRIFVRLFL